MLPGPQSAAVGESRFSPARLPSRLSRYRLSADRWTASGRAATVAQDFDRAGLWLAALQGQSAGPRQRVTWGAEVIDALTYRWDGHRDLGLALRRLHTAHSRLRIEELPTTVVHGDFCAANVSMNRVGGFAVTGWRCGSVTGQPLRDLAWFALSYPLPPSQKGAEGPFLRTRPAAPQTVHRALLADDWFARLVRRFLADGLARLGGSVACWYPVALVGLGEIAARSDDAGLARTRLEALASMPEVPGSPD